jgi:hypothetical protein
MPRLQSGAALLAFLALASCDDTGGPPTPREGATRVLLTDAPFPYDQVARADIYVMRVAAASAGSSTEQTIVAPNRTFDLVALQNGRTAELGEGVLTPGTYDRVFLEIDIDRSSLTLKDGTVLTRGSTPGIRWTGSGGAAPPPLAVFVDVPIEVTTTGTVLVVDFDLARSFRPMNPADVASGVEYTPFARAVDASATGSLSGSISGEGGGALADATVTLYAIIPSAPPGSPTPSLAFWETARTDAGGRFVLPYLSSGRTYSLVAEGGLASPHGSATPRQVSVTAGSETNLGTVTVPRYDPATLPGTYVLRWVGGAPRPLPVMIWPGPTQIFLDSDTLTVNGDGTGSEVRVDRIVPPGQPGTPRVTRTDFTYNRVGRALTIVYPCPAGSTCSSPQGAIGPGWLTLYLPGAATSGAFGDAPWPRTWERVGP